MICFLRRLALRAFLVALASLAYTSRAQAAPRIDNVSLRGLQLGGATTLVIQGAELLPAPRLWLGQEAISATVKDGSTAEQLTVEIALPATAFPGIRQLRLSSESGISNAAAVVIDELPELGVSTEPVALPAAVSGVCAGSTRVLIPIDGKQQQALVVEVEARRLGSMLNPTLRVLDDQGVQIAWAQGEPRLAGDARIVTTLPRDGRYQIELHDALFQAPAPAHFRLKIVGEAAASMPYLRPMNADEIRSRGLESLLGGELVTGAWRPLRSQHPSHFPTGQLRMFVSPWREVAEHEDARLGGPLATPIGVNGTIGSPGEIDQYQFTAAAGVKVRVECYAERAYSPLDGVLEVRDSAGGNLASSDDQVGTVDPGVEFAVPSAEPVTLTLRDLRRRGGEEFRYRLAIAPADVPEMRLTLDADRYLVPRGGAAIVRVHVDRVGFAGEVALHFDGLPPGILVEGANITAGASDALVSLRSVGEAAAAVIHVRGEAIGLAAPLVRSAQVPATAESKYSPWLANEVAVATTTAAPLTVAWDTSTAQDALMLASTTQLAAQLTREANAAGPVRLSLLTTQVPPTKQENNQTLPDVERTLRLAQDVVTPADHSAAALPIAVPADLAEMPYDLVLKAELLSADGAQVLATAYSASRRLPVATPTFTLELAGAAQLKPAADDKYTLELHGKIVRPAGFTRPVTVNLGGLPEGIPAPSVIVPEGQSEFTLSANVPKSLTLGDLSAAKLVAASQLAPEVVVRSANEVTLTLQLGAAE